MKGWNWFFGRDKVETILIKKKVRAKRKKDSNKRSGEVK